MKKKKKTKKFAVRFSRELKISLSGTIQVRAKSEEEAEKIAKTLVGSDMPGSLACEIDTYDIDVVMDHVNESIRTGNFEDAVAIDGVDALAT
jgi:hypothetical protein